MPPLRDTHPGRLLQGRHELEPRTGLLVVFPAWLWHEAEPNESDHERICISFNIGMTTPPMEPTT
jgi:ectoine hydroxylase-related dioxygenase (phytanoyl-CoA dioxygenase family)